MKDEGESDDATQESSIACRILVEKNTEMKYGEKKKRRRKEKRKKRPKKKRDEGE